MANDYARLRSYIMAYYQTGPPRDCYAPALGARRPSDFSITSSERKGRDTARAWSAAGHAVCAVGAVSGVVGSGSTSSVVRSFWPKVRRAARSSPAGAAGTAGREARIVSLSTRIP
jgi:hypothetical protein